MKKRKKALKIVNNYYIDARTYIQNSTIGEWHSGGINSESPQAISATKNESKEDFWGDFKKRAITAAKTGWEFAKPVVGKILGWDNKDFLPPAAIWTGKILLDNHECLSNFIQITRLCN